MAEENLWSAAHRLSAPTVVQGAFTPRQESGLISKNLRRKPANKPAEFPKNSVIKRNQRMVCGGCTLGKQSSNTRCLFPTCALVIAQTRLEAMKNPLRDFFFSMFSGKARNRRCRPLAR